MAALRVAVVAGATGLTGGHLLRQLLADDRYARVSALVRQPSLPTNRKLVECIVDFDALPALPKADDAFCCLGTTIKIAGSQKAFRHVDFDFVVNFARAAKQAGATQFLVISALGANAKSPIFYSRVKGEMENVLYDIGFETLHIFQPSLILGERSQQRPAEKFGIAAFNTIGALMLGPLRKYRPIEAKTIARGMVRAALAERRGVYLFSSDAIEEMTGN